MTWPPRWEPGPHFKEMKSGKVERRDRRVERDGEENKQKKEVRKRDGQRCRFPLCGCKKFQFALHVSHRVHKGAGGNPAGNRSQAKEMILVCVRRHREGKASIDMKTVQWRALTTAGSNGPVAWLVEASIFPAKLRGYTGHKWLEVARERSVGVLEPVNEWQAELLKFLALMTC